MADRTPEEMLAAVREFADLCVRSSGDIPSADVAWKLRGILNSTPDAYAKHGAAALPQRRGRAGRPTALLIPSPWSGDERDPAGRLYRWWFRLYVATRRIRHLVGLHDWDRPRRARCTWCGSGG